MILGHSLASLSGDAASLNVTGPLHRVALQTMTFPTAFLLSTGLLRLEPWPSLCSFLRGPAQPTLSSVWTPGPPAPGHSYTPPLWFLEYHLYGFLEQLLGSQLSWVLPRTMGASQWGLERTAQRPSRPSRTVRVACAACGCRELAAGGGSAYSSQARQRF